MQTNNVINTHEHVNNIQKESPRTYVNCVFVYLLCVIVVAEVCTTSCTYAPVICIHAPPPTGMGGDNDFSLFRALV